MVGVFVWIFGIKQQGMSRSVRGFFKSRFNFRFMYRQHTHRKIAWNGATV